MNKPIKTKLCWNCEGSVSRSAENCPYCAVYLSPENDDPQEESAFKAPYKPEREKATLEVPKAPYIPGDDGLKEEAEDGGGKESVLPSSLSLFQSTFIPLIFLTTGLIFLFFSAMLLLFSENGKLNLQWDGESWYLYAMLALPMLFFGWRFLDQSDS